MKSFLTTFLFLAALFFIPLARGDDAAASKKIAADEVRKLWSANLKDARSFHEVGASPKDAPDTGAWSFSVEGVPFETLWNHYAAMCGAKERYKPRTYLTSGNTSDKGAYVIADRIPQQGEPAVSVFLLKTEQYTVTVTIQAAAEAKTVVGTLSVAVK